MVVKVLLTVLHVNSDILVILFLCGFIYFFTVVIPRILTVLGNCICVHQEQISGAWGFEPGTSELR